MTRRREIVLGFRQRDGGMSQLTMRLFGGFEAQAGDGRPLTVPTRKAQALLAYLSLTPGQAHPRDKLAALLWTEASPAAARNALRQTLFVLRKALGTDRGATLLVTGDALTLPADMAQTDVAAFEQAIALGTPPALESAVALYRGDLLVGLSTEAPGFEEWLMSERERLRELAIEGFARLLAHQRAVGATEAAVQLALRLLALDPLQEAVHRTLMRLYAQLGRRDAALRQYQECVEILRRELAVEPEAETKALYREILRQRPVQASITSVAGAPAETPLLGRDTELSLAHRSLAEAFAGSGHVLAVAGEAGIGKSRMLTELAAEAGRRGASVLLGRAYESERILPLGPWVGAVRDSGVLTDSRRLEGLGNVWRAELARVFPELADTAPPPTEPSDLQRLFDALAELLRHLAVAQPLVILLEDCHWADDATLRFLGFFARRIRSAPILLALSVREEEIADTPLLRLTLEELAGEQHLTRLTLGRLGREDTLKLVQWFGRADTRIATAKQRDEQVWAASAGNPFVVIETMRAIGSGVAVTGESPGGLPLPASVGEMIVRRLDRLSERARQLVRVAAVIGCEFEFALLRRAAGLGEPETADGVEELVRRRILHGIGDRFDFSHERIRDVVVAELLGPRRQLLHAAIAAAMEERVGQDVLRHTVALGTHYREAGIWDKAVVCLRQAGRLATDRCAYREAVALLEQARSALASLQESRATLEQAFEIRMELRNALLPLGDYPAIMEHMLEAGTLAQRLGDARRQVRSASFLLNYRSWSGGHAMAIDEGRRALAMAEALGDLEPLVHIRTRLGEARHSCGQYRDAAALFRQNIAALAGDRARERFGLLQPPAVHSRTWLAASLSELGMFQEARAVAAEALTIAQQIDEPVALNFAWAAAGQVALQLGEFDEAVQALERAVHVWRGDTPPWQPRFTGALGLAYALSGDPARGIVLLDRALEQTATLGVLSGRSVLLVWLADAWRLATRDAEACEAAANAIELATRHGERGHLARALRARADALARGGADDLEHAARIYREACALADELHMRPLVAHCQFGLGSLYARAGKREQAILELVAAEELFAVMEMERWRVRAEGVLDDLR
jgi:DNA-binding SARP family transcriptional activator